MAPVHVLRGSDAVVLGRAVTDLLDALVADGDRGLLVEELTSAQLGDPPDAGPIVNAARTPPFLTDRRIVLAREVAVLSTTSAVGPIVEYLAEPLATTTLVMVWEKGPRQSQLPRLPKKLADALKAVAGVLVDTTPPTKGRAGWIDDQLRRAGLKLDAAARSLVAEQFGEDVSRVAGLVEALAGTYGPGAAVGADEVLPFLGEKGGAAPWDLTDAIDAGDIPLALEQLHRLLGAGERHAIGLMYTLHGHYQRMLALDGSDVTDGDAAAALLGTSPYPARKALQQGRRLGSDGIAEAIGLLARADLDLRGLRAWPPELVLEVLVARLAQRARRRR